MKYLPPRLATEVTKEIAVHRDLTFGRLLVPSSVSFFSGISIPVLTGGGRPVCRGRAAQRLTSSGRPVPLRVRRSRFSHRTSHGGLDVVHCGGERHSC